MITEDQLEQLCLSWFSEAGWQVVHGPHIAPDGDNPERSDYRQVILYDRLKTAAENLNPAIPKPAIEEALHSLLNLSEPTLIGRNRSMHRLILAGIPVEWQTDEGSKHDLVRLLDFAFPDANDFCVANQFTVQGSKQPRRPDVVAFINGLPVAVIELKNPADEQADIWDAWNQLQTYKDEIPDLFAANTALVISDGFNARLGSLTADQERFMRWRTVKDENDKPLLDYQLQTLVRGFFDRELLLDYIRHFVLFETDGDRLIKKIAGYHQFHAVREAVRATVIAAATPEAPRKVQEQRATYGDEVEPGSRKAGVVWHTQGSGKSISMCCYAGKLLKQPEMRNPTLVVVTDRNDLDGQLFQTFSGARELLGETPIRIGDENDSYPTDMPARERLRQELSKRQSGGIIFTTIQKFSLADNEDRHPALSQRQNIVVISDEAHRSQYGLEAKFDTKKNRYVYGFARHLRDALPEASFIGFTGTPIANEDKDTRAVFGDYVSIYDIQDAVDDGATVPIYYESRLVKIDINRAEIDELNTEVDEVLEDEEEVVREATKGRWAALAELVGAEDRLKQVAADLVAHFEERQRSMPQSKAMIVCMKRDIAAALFKAIVALRPDWAGTRPDTKEDTSGGYYDPTDGALRIVMTGSASDKAALQPHIYNASHKKTLEKRFRDPKDSLKLVIVRDMWLTGFDAPCCNTMYVDKPMKGHNLMQAIARVNRVFKDKQGGLVVDYIGIANNLKAGLKTYTESQGKGDPTHMADEAFTYLQRDIDAARGMFATPVDGKAFDYSAYATNALALLLPAANHILGLNPSPKDAKLTGKKRFLDAVTSITKAYSLCATLDRVAAYREEIAFFSAIKAVIMKHTQVDTKRSQADKYSALKAIIDNAVVAAGVEDIFALAGLDKPNISLLSDEFLDEVRAMPHKNLAVELLEKLLRDDIKSRSRTNLVQEKKFTDRLLASLAKYHNRAIETAQVIEELISMAKDFAADCDRQDALGLNPDEIAFYDALCTNESALREMTDDTLKAIAHELTEKIRNSATVDWQKRDSVRARMRNIVRRLLKKYKYPPDKDGTHDASIDLVLSQAEKLADVWSTAS